MRILFFTILFCHISTASLSGQIREEVRARHILIGQFDLNDTSTRTAFGYSISLTKSRVVADSLLSLLLNGTADFEALALKFGTDATAKRGGDLGWFGRGEMVKPFEQAVFDRLRVGVPDTVTTQFGIHLVEVTDVKFQKR